MLNSKTGYSLAILSAVLLFLSFPPFKFGWILGWFALVPMFVALYYQTRVKDLRKVHNIAALGFLPVVFWLGAWTKEVLILEFHITGRLPQIAYFFGILMGVGIGMGIMETFVDYFKPKDLPSRRLRYLTENPLLGIFAVPVIWTAIEFLVMSLPGILRIGGMMGVFSVSKTQWFNPPILQLASFTGVYGLTFLVLLVNSAIAYGLIRYMEGGKLLTESAVILLVFLVLLAWGFLSIPSVEEGDVGIALIQISDAVKKEKLFDSYMDLTEKSLSYGSRMIMWPFSFQAIGVVNNYENFSSEHNVYLTNGGLTLLRPDGRVEEHNMAYHMVTLFGQIGSGNWSAVLFPEPELLETEFGKAGTVICFESCFPRATRHLVQKGAGFLFVSSPDNFIDITWLIGTNAVFRAVEHRMYAASTFNHPTGAMLVDPFGRIIEDVAPEPEIVAGKVSFTDDRTFYTKHGDVFGWLVVLLALGMISYDFLLKKRSPYRYCVICRSKMEKKAKLCPRCGSGQPGFLKRFLFHHHYGRKENGF